MNVEKLYKVTDFILEDIKNYGIQKEFDAFMAALQNYASSSTTEQYQTTYVEKRDALFSSLENCDYNNMSFAEKEILAEMGNICPLGIQLADEIKTTLEPNSTLPAQMFKDMGLVKNEFDVYIGNLENLVDSFKALKISKESGLLEGQGEITVLFPRKIINGDLEVFETDVKIFRKFFDTIAEISGDKCGYKLNKISSSEFIITLVGICSVVTTIAVSINQLLDIFQKSINIRKTLQEMKEQKAPKDVMESLTKYHKSIIKDGIKETVQITMKESKISDKARANELENQLSLFLEHILPRLDKGYQVTVTLDEEPEEEVNEEGETIAVKKEIKTLHEKVNQLNASAEEIIRKISQDGDILKLPILDFKESCVDEKTIKSPKKCRKKKES